jgi:hypothetical protein
MTCTTIFKRSLFVLLAGSILLPAVVEAVPAFARKYRMSCTTCHAPAPRLKAYGEEFAGNGFVLADQESSRYYVETGDKDLDLIRELPLAIRFEGFLKHETSTGKEIDFTAPYNLKLLSGGALTRNVAYYFYFFLSERGEVAGIEDAFLMFNNVGNSDLDVYVGQFQVSDPLFKRELRLFYQDYHIYRLKIGDSRIDMAYDRGLMFTYGFESGTDLVVEILNGNGIGPADESRTYDDDKYKNFFGRISQDFGPFARLGGCAYYGKEAADNQTNELWMLGVDGTVGNDRIKINAQFIERRDDNPWFEIDKPNEIKSSGSMAELTVMPEGERSRFYFGGLFNWVNSSIDFYDYQRVTGHAGYLLRTNIRLFAETTYDIENEENQLVVGFVSAF